MAMRAATSDQLIDLGREKLRVGAKRWLRKKDLVSLEYQLVSRTCRFDFPREL
jgi:hypothetical protein